MKKKKPVKDFNVMTADEIIAHVSHPKVAETLRKHVEEHTKRVEEKEKRVKK
jgi:hypothetical protein